MRHLVLAAAILALAACGGERNATAPTTDKKTTAPAATTAKPAAAPKADPAAAAPAPVALEPKPAEPTASTTPADAPAAKVINSICPVTGLAVDPSIPAVEVVVDVVHPPQLLLIGVSNADAAKRVAADPERFAAAARNNREARSPTNPAAGAGQR